MSSKLIRKETNGLIHIREPFCIKDDASALLLARYMVEDNDKDHLLLDMHRRISRPIVRSIFKKIVGDYKVLDMKTEITLASELAEVIQMKITEHDIINE